MFGRKLETNEVLVINRVDLPNYYLNRVVVAIIDITEDKVAIKMNSNINSLALTELNSSLTTTHQNKPSTVKSNVAVAAAITS